MDRIAFGPPLSARTELQDIELGSLSQEPCGATRMSALGQERTSPVHLAMSALPPKADIAWSYIWSSRPPKLSRCSPFSIGREAEERSMQHMLPTQAVPLRGCHEFLEATDSLFPSPRGRAGSIRKTKPSSIASETGHATRGRGLTGGPSHRRC